MSPRWRLWPAGLVMLVGACSPAPLASPAGSSPSTSSPSAAASPSPTGTATSSPTPIESASPAPTSLAVDSLIEIVVTDLVVRTHPGTDPPSTILTERLIAPDRAFVVDGPVEAAGYEWYLVAPLLRPDDTRGPFGWIASGSREGEDWVRAVAAPCPDPVDLAGVIALQPLERLACFGDETLTLTAPVMSCGSGGGPWTFSPSWILHVGGCGLAADASAEQFLLFREPPGSSGPGSAPATVTGHFDDASALTCTVTSADPAAYPAPSREEAVVMCRSEFVIGPGS
jgi:hypothetical protein